MFSETFKLSVLSEYYSSGLSQYAISKKYSLDHSCLYRWQKEYPIASKELSLPSATIESFDMAEKQPELTETEKRHCLELEKMRSRAFEKMIEIAEQEEGISILKKDGAKR